MKKQLLEIIETELEETKIKSFLLEYCGDLIDGYEKRREDTKEKFQKLLVKYNFQNIEDFSEYPSYPQVTLFKGVDEYTFWPVIDYEGGVSDMDKEIGVIIQQADVEINFKTQNQIEEGLLFDKAWSYHHKIIFTWLATIWQEIEGWESGMVVKTLENNSTAEFFFNDLSWDDLSIYKHYNDKESFVERFFDRDLTIFEIYQRVSINTYPINPYQNIWRRFSDGNEVFELVSYGNETGENKYPINQERAALNIVSHKNLIERIKYVHNKSKEWIEAGYREKLVKEKFKEKIYPEAIETAFHSGIAAYHSEQKNRLEIQQIEAFERKYGIQLPFHFKHYLRLFNGRKYNKYRMNFHIGSRKILESKGVL